MSPVSSEQIKISYALVKRACHDDWGSSSANAAIISLAKLSLDFLRTQCRKVDLVSRVPNKDYISYSLNGTVARPVNTSLFLDEEPEVERLWQLWMSGDIDKLAFARLSYTVALAPCLVMELFDRGNKKGPATYFECYIGHIFARILDVNPTKSASLDTHGRKVRLTMDFLFDTGTKMIHLPVKMSTRERVVQAWAHQSLLDSAFGIGQYQGIMVLFSETKLDSRSLEVIEICVPDQWLAYQSFLSKMSRIYYFDVPVRYQELTDEFPDIIQIKQFGEFFTEINEVVN